MDYGVLLDKNASVVTVIKMSGEDCSERCRKKPPMTGKPPVIRKYPKILSPDFLIFIQNSC